MSRRWWRAMMMMLVVVGGGAMLGCSPEASRVRGGGPGADPGNRDAEVEIHGRIQPSYQTPLFGRAVTHEEPQ